MHRSVIAVIFSVLSSVFVVEICDGYKPVWIIHGVLGVNGTMLPLAKRIKQVHPGTVVYISDRYEGWASLEPMWRQADKFGEDLANLTALHPEGIHLIGYSQGGLVSRALLEKFPQHNVKTFISLSSPQAGQYGTKFLHLFFPDLVCETAYKLFYSLGGQLTSIGNYWNDPHHQELYYNYSAFLPFLNNEVADRRNASFKRGLTKLDRLVLLGGPDDGVITPWQSSMFGYYDANETVVNMRDREVYLEDHLGLKLLDSLGKLHLFPVHGVQHIAWKKNISVIDNYIIPFLD